MKSKETVYSLIRRHKIAAVLRGKADEVLASAERLVGAGIKVLEVTFTVCGAEEIIKSLSEKYSGGDITVGAGTVLDAETARLAILKGAEFVVTPAAAIDVIKVCNRYSTAVIPGVATATELLSVLDYGADFVKLFPANIGVLKALKGPFPNVSFMVTGGVGLDNLSEWFKAGASAVGAGSNLTGADADIKKWMEAVK
ncbi:MAG: bifunctional 4-hydroxy-2-oxoglutarate aldolase/2-dehydro-3-deoxy-phosphogluconate aldolase [Clostridiales bacterium]|jgi:2-dehydro-3-deoxyphosphogluconate aldolase/(4S)-4-hydroxy-2-oxoglutarate aldolase|nr:bifunctional 4-hydroxy-2-oxoglutarate aldolase/2-dehydro-3-deoxy-phosphogluconate aldolase [Clostridiales bacterium]